MIKSFLNIINRINTDFKEHIVKTSIVVLVFVTSYLLLENIFLAFIISSAVAILVLNWDSRVFIGIALIFLISCPILLAMEKKTVAEEMAVYAYYMLALGVFLQIIQYFKESFASPKLRKGKPRKKVTPIEFWGKKKVIGFVLGTTVIVSVVFIGSFSFLYSKIENKFQENQEILTSLINNHLEENKKTVDRLVENQQKLADKIFAAEKVDWENVKVLVENTSGQKELAEEVAIKFEDLGCARIYINQANRFPYQDTLVEYCPGCFEITQELLTVLENSDQLTVRENSDLADEIRFRLGADQIVNE